jgi:hypothetical protein
LPVKPAIVLAVTCSRKDHDAITFGSLTLFIGEPQFRYKVIYLSIRLLSIEVNSPTVGRLFFAVPGRAQCFSSLVDSSP